MDNNRKILISTAGSRFATVWTRSELMWSEFTQRLRIPQRGTESLEQYLNLKKQQQDNLKDVGGFVGGTFRNDRRKKANVEGRDLITLDLDNIQPGGTDEILKRVSSLQCATLVYSTRKHSAYKPRLRIVIPTDRTVTADEYEPIARKVAEWLDLAACDPTTFDSSRLMYWASVCRDGDYIYQVYDKPFLSADGVLAKYKNWRNQTEWAIVPGTEQHIANHAAKQADPTTKDNIIGRFCRCYDIFAAMDKFLPGVYEPTNTDNRYTYKAGSTTGGAIVYEGGKFLFSNHATDPCSGELVNSFDLVRLHLFSDLDVDIKQGTPVNKIPSFLAMSELASNDEAVKKLFDEEEAEKVRHAFDDVEISGKTEADFSWIGSLDRTKSGDVKNTIDNYKLILENDEDLKGKIALEVFANELIVTKRLPWDDSEVSRRKWTNEDDAYLAWFIEKRYMIVSESYLNKAITISACKNKINVVADYLKSLKWDGKKRIETALHDYLGAEATVYTAAVLMITMCAAVIRAIKGVTKFDTMPILVGEQGIGKSTFLANLGKDWFSDSLTNFEGKDAAEMLRGVWINEIGELTALNKSEAAAIKQFMSKKEDIYRAPYARRTESFPRRGVFIGTSNEDAFLRDQTGNRRFLPVQLGVCKPSLSVWDDMPGEVDQMWAEAYVRAMMGEKLYLSGEAEKTAKLMQEEFREVNPWEGLIVGFLEKQIPEDWYDLSVTEQKQFLQGQLINPKPLVPRTKVCVSEIWELCLDGNMKFLKKTDSTSINNVLKNLKGWSKGKNPLRFGRFGKQKGFIADSFLATNSGNQL